MGGPPGPPPSVTQHSCDVGSHDCAPHEIGATPPLLPPLPPPLVLPLTAPLLPPLPPLLLPLLPDPDPAPLPLPVPPPSDVGPFV
jgi:hypothetical protein